MINGKTIGIDARMIEMSGIGTYIQHLMDQGIYDYAVGSEEQIRKYDKSVKVIPFDANIYKLKEQLNFPNRQIKKAGIDIMHFPHYNVPVSYRGRYMVTVHDLTHIIFPEFLGRRIKYVYAKALMKQAVRRAEHVFTVSNNSKEDIIKYFGVPENKISITYNAIDDSFTEKAEADYEYLYNKYNIPRTSKILLYVGNLKPHKNLVTLLRAAADLRDEDIAVVLAGKAFKDSDLEQQERQMGIREKVIHTGLVSKEELIDLYNLADIFVFPSLYEGFGIPPLEAMACGTPVIAANNSSIPEVVGDAAVLFDATDKDELVRAIRKTLGSTDLQKELIKNGYSRVKAFSWNDTVEIIKSTIASGTGK